MKNLIDYIDSRFSPDKHLCSNNAYRTGAERFSEIINTLEEKHPEDRELLYELVTARAVLETATAKHMFRKGLANRWKAHPQNR